MPGAPSVRNPSIRGVVRRHMVNKPLAPQERKIIDFAATGLTDKETANKLGVTVGTIRTYWERIREKLQTFNRTHSVADVLTTEHNSAIKNLRREIARLQELLFGGRKDVHSQQEGASGQSPHPTRSTGFDLTGATFRRS